MTNVEIILNALGLLGYGQESSQASVLKFFDVYQQQVKYIGDFLNIFNLSLREVQAKEELIKLFDQFNHKNWQEIDQHLFQESEYYLFLRLKVFLLHFHEENDMDETVEWLNFFQEKFLYYLFEQ
ncbi:hypothetical protein AWW72_15160 [Acinetobacter sp. NRRL B-65365]|uniref:hypothetical protein n=1 Tax=Acinetobacter sp. NRRL B-65365 TaxID=1785092 RepID=UPI0007A06F95|nr:hypothetical protein [Acinetobacter sp. NRRL B-65365]KYQ83250.1 hypothetical protein AWW72_15160 [Acinetobacter sp. NRRL B-65365]